VSPRRVTSEHSTQDIDFERGRLGGESLRLHTASALKAWAEDEGVKQCPDQRTRQTEKHTDQREIPVSENAVPIPPREAQHGATDAEAPKMAAWGRVESSLLENTEDTGAMGTSNREDDP
jgi:hypothetical protein